MSVFGQIGLLWRVFRKVRAVVVMAAVAAGLWSAGRVIGPAVVDAYGWVAAAEDPVALARRELAGVLAPERVGAEIAEALAAGDVDLARSFVALAEAEGVAVPPEARAALAAAESGRVWAGTKAFARGAFLGDADGVSGMAGAFAADVIGVGDVRDLVREGWHAANDEPVDEILIGLSAVGLAVTGATWVMAGTPAPVRAGLTLVKATRKAGRLSAPLAAALGRTVGEVVDMAAARRGLVAAGRFDVSAAKAAARDAVRLERVAPLARLGDDVATLYGKAGVRAVDDALALARNPAEVGRFARLAEGFGEGTRATMKLLGRGAVLLGRSLAVLAGWFLAAAGWFLSLASAAAAFGRWLGRLGRRAPAVRADRTGPFGATSVGLPA